MHLSWGVLIVDVVSSTASPLDLLLRESSAAPNVFCCALSLALCGPCGNSILNTLLINVYLSILIMGLVILIMLFLSLLGSLTDSFQCNHLII